MRFGKKKRLTDYASCAGWAGKIPPEAIAQVVRDLPPSTDPRLIVGAEGFSDAGVFEVAADLLLVQSLDFFAPLVDDPFAFGQIAAANSLSDVFAMGASPITALNMVCFPDDTLGVEVLSEILRGGTQKVHEAGGSIAGGHSIRDKEIKYGLSVTGVVTRDKLITNQNARPGDVLVLTKKLGTGFVTTAMKKNRCSAELAQEAIDGMACLNRQASRATQQCGAKSATDITGFGLAVHACEMAQASGVSLEIELGKLPILPGALDLCKKGFVTRANKTNREFCQSLVSIAEGVDGSVLEIAFDPQTSGGLLISVSPEKADELVELVERDSANVACVVGSVASKNSHFLHLK